MTTKKRFVGLCLLYCFSLPSSSVSGHKNPRSKRIRNITNTPVIFLRQKGNRNEPKGNRLRYTFATLSLAAGAPTEVVIMELGPAQRLVDSRLSDTRTLALSLIRHVPDRGLVAEHDEVVQPDGAPFRATWHANPDVPADGEVRHGVQVLGYCRTVRIHDSDVVFRRFE